MVDNSKPAATMIKAISLFKNKHFVSSYLWLYAAIPHLLLLQSEMVERHIRAVNRVATANKRGYVSTPYYCNVNTPILVSVISGVLDWLN